MKNGSRRGRSRTEALRRWGRRPAGPLAIALGAGFVGAIALVAWLLSRPAGGVDEAGTDRSGAELAAAGSLLPGTSGSGRQSERIELTEPDAPPPPPPPVASGPGEEWLARLDPGWLMDWTATGRVVREDGTPVSGAEVAWLPDSGTVKLVRRLLGETVEVQGRALTDDDGAFALASRRVRPWADRLTTGYGGGRTGALVVVAAGFLDQPVSMDTLGPHGGDLGEIELVPGARVFGRVLDPQRQPLAGVEVALRTQSDSGKTPGLAGFGSDLLPRWRRMALTDDEGRFDFRDTWPGRARLTLSRADLRGKSTPSQSVEAGAELDFGEIELEPGLALEGRVVDAQGRPLEGAVVEVVGYRLASADLMRLFDQVERGRTQREGPDACTDRDGAFRILGRASAPQTLVAIAPGFAPGAVDDVWPGTGAVIELRLQPWKTCELRVLGPEGAALDGVAVRSLPRGAFDGPPVTRRADGVFLLPDVGQSLYVEASAPGFARTVVSFEAPGPHELRLAAAATLEGRVRDPAGAPVPGALVTVRCGNADTPDECLADSKETDADGGFHFEELVAGDWTLSVFADGRPPVVDQALQLPLPPGEVREIVLSDPARILGHLLDAEGRLPEDVANERVWIRVREEERSEDHWATAQADGRFAFEQVLPGTWDVHWRDASREVRVGPGETVVVDLRREPARVIAGVVQDAAGRPVPKAHVRWRLQQQTTLDSIGVDDEIFWNSSGSARADGNGSFELSLPQAGDYELTGIGPGGGEGAPVAVRVFAGGAPQRVTLVLATGSVEGVVVDAVEGQPLAKARVSRTGWSEVSTEENGHFRVEFLPAGELELAAQADGYLRRNFTQPDLGEGEAREGLRLELTREARLEVRVRGPNGGLVESGLTVGVWRRDGKPWSDGRALKASGLGGGVADFDGLEAVEANVTVTRSWLDWAEGAAFSSDGTVVVPYGLVLRAGETTRLEIPAP